MPENACGGHSAPSLPLAEALACIAVRARPVRDTEVIAIRPDYRRTLHPESHGMDIAA